MNDQELIAEVEATMQVKLRPYAAMDTIDSWAEKNGHMVACVERKTRNVPFGQYPTAVVDHRKWLGLLANEFATGIPSYLVYGWSCGSWGWIQPTTVGQQLGISVIRPSLDSVSLNAGVPRPVVEIPLSAFSMVNVVGLVPGRHSPVAQAVADA